MNSLKLVALDRDDLEVVSAHLQDAVIKTGDIRWRPSEHRLVIGLCRFDWEAAHADVPEYRRRYAALRFDDAGFMGFYAAGGHAEMQTFDVGGRAARLEALE